MLVILFIDRTYFLYISYIILYIISYIISQTLRAKIFLPLPLYSITGCNLTLLVRNCSWITIIPITVCRRNSQIISSVYRTWCNDSTIIPDIISSYLRFFFFFLSDDSRQDALACQRLTVLTTCATVWKKERKRDARDVHSLPACSFPQFPRKNRERLSFLLRHAELDNGRKIIKQ